MSTTPKISVIMGIYNCGETLQEALDSLYAQTYQDFEIILCDDGSSDNTYQIAQENAAKHSNIVLLRNEQNRKLSYTLNHCLKYAKGIYIARMDSDDISLPTRFEKQVTFLDNHARYAIVCCPMIRFDQQGDYKYGKDNAREVSKKDFIYGCPIGHPTAMVRKEAYESVGGYSESKRHIRSEDYYLWYTMYRKGFIAYKMEEHLLRYRDDRNAFSKRHLKYRIGEARTMALSISHFRLNPIYYLYCLRTIIVGLLPYGIYKELRKRLT